MLLRYLFVMQNGSCQHHPLIHVAANTHVYMLQLQGGLPCCCIRAAMLRTATTAKMILRDCDIHHSWFHPHQHGHYARVVTNSSSSNWSSTYRVVDSSGSYNSHVSNLIAVQLLEHSAAACDDLYQVTINSQHILAPGSMHMWSSDTHTYIHDR
jgi:hypothetical protein